MLAEQQRFFAEGPDFGVLTRNAELISETISWIMIIDLTAACGTGKSTVLPVFINEIEVILRVFCTGTSTTVSSGECYKLQKLHSWSRTGSY